MSKGYPNIWKIERCLKGECRGERVTHRWAVPSSTPMGLMTECYDCHKTRKIKCQTKTTLKEEEKNTNTLK